MSAQQSQGEMPFLQHLEVLRWHLMRSVAVILAFAIIAFLNKTILFDVIVFGPKTPDFPTFQWLCSLSAWLYESGVSSNPDSMCIGQNFPELQNIYMAGQFTTHLLVSFIAGLILGFPYLIWELWKFIKPGLVAQEKSYARGIVFWISFLFMLGVLNGYFLIAPLSVDFFFNYSISPEVQTMPTLSNYISTVTTVVLASGVVFELPVAVYFLTKLGILEPNIMRKYRRHFVVFALIFSAIITPPDVFSQILVTIPLYLLFEISIKLSARIIKNSGNNSSTDIQKAE